MVLFHYTSKVGYEGINTTRALMPSSDTVTDSTYGLGHYFTDLEPSYCERRIASHCWQNKYMTFKVEYYLKIEIPDHIVKYCRQHVYLVTNGAISSFTVLDKGQKPLCKLKPCELCQSDPTS
jgi:hypothetical protein